LVSEKNNEFTSIMDHIAAGIAKVDTSGQFIHLNTMYCDLLGYSADELIGRNFATITNADDYIPLKALFDELVAGKRRSIRVKNRVINKAGELTWIYLSATRVKSSDPYVVFVVQDISQEEELDSEQGLAAMTVNHSGNGILVTDATDTIIQVNPAFCRISGFSANEIIGRKPFLLRSGEHDETFYNRIWKTLEQEGFWQGEICYRHRNGSLFYVWESISAVMNEQGDVTNYVSNMADMTQLKLQQQALDELANYDALTELPNRHYFDANLTQAIEMSKRSGSRVALLFIDLDKFKPINDEFGHKAGDNLLAEIAHRIEKSVRKEDTAARLGGDEFVVLMPKIDERAQLETIAERLLERISQPVNVSQGVEVSVTASMGISIYPDDLNNLGENFRFINSNQDSEIVELADQAMYAAKEHEVPLCFFDQINLFSPLSRKVAAN